MAMLLSVKSCNPQVVKSYANLRRYKMDKAVQCTGMYRLYRLQRRYKTVHVVGPENVPPKMYRLESCISVISNTRHKGISVYVPGAISQT
jgi:hypothetical protein